MLIFIVNPHSIGLVDIQPYGWGCPPFLEFVAKFGSTWVVQRLRGGPHLAPSHLCSQVSPECPL